MSGLRLALFFTRGVSLQQWVRQGLFDREKAIYEQHLATGACRNIIWVTYGFGDEALAGELRNQGRLSEAVRVLGMPRLFKSKLGIFLWSLLAPWIFRKKLAKVDILKTNQMDGAWTALLAGFILHKPVYVRTGYTWSKFEVGRGFKARLRHIAARCTEWLLYRWCSVAAVSSQHDRQDLLTRHPGLAGKLFLLPNFIDCNRFLPAVGSIRQERILFVGRFNAQKNLAALLEAAHAVSLGLDLVGGGEEEASLRTLADHLGADVRFLGPVSNNDLPAIFRAHRYFVLPSLYEGMPKALLEAMSCGCLCIGTNVQGINEVIIDGINGLLARGTDAAALQKVLEQAAKAPDAVAIAGAAHIREHYSLMAFVSIEKELFGKALGRSTAE